MPEINDMLLMMKNTIDNRLKSKSRASSVTGNYLHNFQRRKIFIRLNICKSCQQKDYKAS
jgi:hypothetical protein